MISDKLQKIMKQDGVVAIATLGPDGPHMVNTWNSYLKVSPDGRLFIPAGYMHKTEANIAHNPSVLITLGSSKVEGLHGMGAGFLIKGKARFVTSGPDFDFMKEKFGWLRATLAVTNGYSNMVMKTMSSFTKRENQKHAADGCRPSRSAPIAAPVAAGSRRWC